MELGATTRGANRNELRWLLVTSLAILLLTSLPTLYAWSLVKTDHVFSGFVYNVEDGNSYIAKMRLGARGEWLFHLFYTPEPHAPALVYSFYLCLGKLATVLGLSFAVVYHLARVLLGLGLLLMVYVFIAHFTRDVAQRRLAWLLCAVGSGLGWLLTITGRSTWLGNLPLDFWVPEAYIFLVLYSLPHLALAETLLLGAILCTLLGYERGPAWSLWAALLAFFMGWIVPFYAGILASALGAYLLALLLRRRRIPWREAGLTAVAGLGVLPPVAYNAWLFSTNPTFAVWASQNVVLSPHPAHYLLGFGLLLLPAISGGIWAVRQDRALWLLPVAWILVLPILLYLPFNLQRRMCAVAQVPLALLAARGLFIWFRGRWLALAGYVAVASLTTGLLLAGNMITIRQVAEPIYRDRAEVMAIQWLDAQAQTGDCVLSSFKVGNAIPVYADLRVFGGHGPETLYSQDKRAAIERFFRAETGDDWRQGLLAEFGVDYVFYGPHERELGAWSPATATFLAPIYDRDGYAIFTVKLQP